jgi:hypothetical protein
MTLFKAELNLSDSIINLTPVRSFYSSRPSSYIETQGPIGGSEVVETLYNILELNG